MRALVTRIRSNKQREKILVTDWPEPGSPTGKEVKTQTIYSGITNGTERNDLLGGNYANREEDLPAGWGYQNVGRVIETGPDVVDLKVNDILFMSADHMEYVVIPEDDLLIKLSSKVDQRQAALFGMASVAMHTCRNADLRMGEKVLIVGLGCIGQIAAQIARVMGARVMVCDIDPKRLDIARKVGAAEKVFDVSEDGWDKHIGDGVFDAVLDLAGAVDMEDRLINAVRPRGRVLFVAGRFKVSYTFNLGQGREIVIKQNSHFGRDDLENVSRLVRCGMVKIGPILHKVVSVDEASRIFDTLRDRPDELLGTVFVW